MKYYFLILFLFISAPLIAKEKEKAIETQAKETVVEKDPWSVYIHTSPLGDILQRPNFGIQAVYRCMTLGLKASWFVGATQIFDYGFDSSQDFGNVKARGFEIGPQFGYLFKISNNAYFMPRLGIYRSIVHYSGGHSACKNGQTGGCEFPPEVDGWAIEGMAMLHVPVISGFHFEVGAGFGTKFLVELNAGYAF